MIIHMLCTHCLSTILSMICKVANVGLCLGNCIFLEHANVEYTKLLNTSLLSGA